VSTTEAHEGAHAAACLWLGRPIEYVSRTPGLGFPGEELGRCEAPIPEGELIQARDVGVALIGYMAQDRDDWPPPYAAACTEEREALGLLIDLLDIDERQYEELVARTRRLLDDPDFSALQRAIARALSVVPTLTAEDVYAIAQAHGIRSPIHDEELSTCST
jgi:hypothetical protein